jgi:hypothetical protein
LPRAIPCYDVRSGMRLTPKLVAVLAALVLLGCSYYFFFLFIPGMRPNLVARHLAGGYGYCNDFYPIWLASGELFHGRDPYSPELTPRIEIGLYGRALDRRTPGDAQVNMRAFAYPLYTIFLFAPWAAFSFPTVQIIISIVLAPLAALAVFWWLRALDPHFGFNGTVVAICLALASYPVLEGIYSGQPGLLAAALIAGTVLALIRQRYALAGILLPCASIKPQLVLLVGLWLMVWAFADLSKRKGIVLSALTTSALLVAASTWLRPSWFSGWWRMLSEYRRVSPPPLAEFVLGRAAGDALSLFLIALAAWLCWKKRREPANSEGFVLCTVFVLGITALVLPSTIAVYDQFLLLPAALWLCIHPMRILRGSLPLRVLALMAIGALGWQWLTALGVAFASIVLPAVAHSPKLLLLPLRTAASVPFALVALLCFEVVQEIRTNTVPSYQNA